MTRSTKLLAPYLRRQWRALAVAGVASVVTAAAELARPFPLKLLIDQILTVHHGLAFHLSDSDIRVLILAGALIVAIALTDAAASYLIDVRLEKAGERIVHDLRVDVYGHLQRLSLAFHDRRPTGDLVTRVTGDVNAVGDMFSESLGTIATSSLMLVGMVVVTVWIDPILALATFAMTPVLAFVTVRFRRKLKAVARHQRATEGEIASLAGEALGSMRVVKAFAGEEYEGDRLTGRSEEVRRAGVEVARIEGRFTGMIDVTGAIASALVLTIGVFRVASGHLSIGDLVVVNSYARRVYRPLRDIARQGSRVVRAMARGDRIAEVLSSDDVLVDPPHGHAGPRARGEVELSAVSFTYPGRDHGRKVLDDVSLSFPAGQCTALIGPSGAGKSTVVSLVARFYDPRSGGVFIDGRDLRECSLSWLRDQVGVVLQDTVLFSGTVADNIAYGADAGLDDVISAAERVGAHRFICALPDGYDTELGPWGVGLSGGQRQRIAIARTLLRNPSILVLDEPTTGLDAESEAMVIEGLDVLMAGRTVVMVTHSLALARRANRVVVMDHGQVAQMGPPEELLDQPGVFQRLANLQGQVSAPAPTDPVDHDADAEVDASAVPDADRSGPPSEERITVSRGSAISLAAPAAPGGLPTDDGLPGLAVVADPAAMAPLLWRSLGGEGVAWPQVDVHCLRYKPGTNVVVHYLVGLGGESYHATAMIAKDRKLAKRAVAGPNQMMARQVDGRSPAPFPLWYDTEAAILVQWLPLDIRLPGLALTPRMLRRRLRKARVAINSEEPAMINYRPRRRAVVRIGGHIVKVYSSEADYQRAARGLRSAAEVGDVRTPAFEAAIDQLRVTVQASLPGDPVAAPRRAAGEAGRVIAAFHACPPAAVEFEALPPADQLERARRSAALAAVVAPAVRSRVERLMARLVELQPTDLPLVRAHGDFHAGQLLDDRSGLSLIDLDEACEAPAALDLANYAAHLVAGPEADRDRAHDCLEALVDGYGSRPPGLDWYMATAVLRRATRPFRFLDESWSDGVAASVEAASAALRR